MVRHVITDLTSTPEEAVRLSNTELDKSVAGKSVADSAWLGRNFCIVGSTTLHYLAIRKRELSFEEKDHNKVEQWRAPLKIADYSLDTQTYTGPAHLSLGVQLTRYAATNSKQS
ncbi:hypothetical protein GGP41_010604 [Bipolaris sorokiniana]|uniref:Uncharacterized protein n=2 Tax=Cochliobolus sativus TaxID=45130 RepID=A0A8H5ZKK5_COCSA|nr:uncharacterized protein COCSADRAFT_180455 [Bipolaris sorokiniana ND90Pr]EMD65744.1 hypothetical protein COCSADRAFT_180455 [Bipolaris sorokiniana ND90Pr]KAF5850977.1 hypothetical protein GGP41_010604 [Bipolaris sorokiniana]